MRSARYIKVHDDHGIYQIPAVGEPGGEEFGEREFRALFDPETVEEVEELMLWGPWQTVLKVAYRDDEYGTLHTLFSSVIADEFLDEEL